MEVLLRIKSQTPKSIFFKLLSTVLRVSEKTGKQSWKPCQFAKIIS